MNAHIAPPAPSGALSAGHLMERVELTRHEFDLFNHARQDFNDLHVLLMEAVIPALGGGGHPVVSEIHDLFERVILYTGNFLFKYSQQIGQAYRERDL